MLQYLIRTKVFTRALDHANGARPATSAGRRPRSSALAGRHRGRARSSRSPAIGPVAPRSRRRCCATRSCFTLVGNVVRGQGTTGARQPTPRWPRPTVSIVVNPRYGSWDASTLQLSDLSSPGAVLPQDQHRAAGRRAAVSVTGSVDRLLEAVRVMDRLRSPGGCPWDAAQTHESLAPYLLEETYETLEAIELGDPAAFREELGDLLLQVLFHARLAEEVAAPRDSRSTRWPVTWSTSSPGDIRMCSAKPQPIPPRRSPPTGTRSRRQRSKGNLPPTGSRWDSPRYRWQPSSSSDRPGWPAGGAADRRRNRGKAVGRGGRGGAGWHRP